MENQVEIIKQVNDQEVMDSRDVAKMIGKRHTDLVRDIRRYISDMSQNAKLRSDDFFIESSYTQKGNGKAVGGAILAGGAGGIGSLAGFAGKQTGKSDWVCLDCGRSFTIK